VIIACGLYLLAEEEKRKKRKLWVHKVFRAREEEGEFHTLFGRLKDDRQKCYKYFRMSVSKFEALMSLSCPGPSQTLLCFTLATASEIGMPLITNFLELGMVTPSGHKLASRQHAVTLPL
jgi:hypothetical protein